MMVNDGEGTIIADGEKHFESIGKEQQVWDAM